MKKGKVYLIGAGPGDPELFTLKGKRCLEKADVIVGDYLADKRILRFANKNAEYIYVGKSCGSHTMTQQDISRLLAEKGKEGKIVARLKGGDPFVFGRGGEEIEVLRAAGVDFEVVPGVTSAIAAPAYAGIPVTHRKVEASFAVITGHEDPTKGHSDIHWEKLAGAVDTLVFLMGVGRTQHIAEELIRYGKSADTPAAFVRWGTRPYQETYTTTLGEAAEAVKKYGIKPPSVFIVGNVVNLRGQLRWYDNKPLFGKHVVITRSRTQASRLTEVLEDLGAFCTEIPSIKIESPDDGWASIDQGIEKLAEYNWIVFTSQNGVDAFFKRIYEKGFDKEKFTFYNNDQKIEIILKGKEMTLANGPSLLNLSYHRKIGNHYHTDYGMIELFTELITMEHDRYLKVKYILSDEHQHLSEVYVMMKYDFNGEENEAI